MESDFKDYPKSCDEKDYWAQVKRTVNGQPVSEKQIQLIIDAIKQNLELFTKNSDFLLDLGCGNGALSEFFFPFCKSFLGVDYSEYLISIANRDFANSHNVKFIMSDVLDYTHSEQNPERFNKILSYGCFSYFPSAEDVLVTLFNRFKNVTHIFIGNLPDLNKVNEFYKEKVPAKEELLSYNSKIGIWRTQQQFIDLAEKSGWDCKINLMPKDFYASHYRFDVLLTRN